MDKREIADLSNIKDNVAFHFYLTDKVWYIGVLEMLFWTGRHFFFPPMCFEDDKCLGKREQSNW